MGAGLYRVDQRTGSMHGKRALVKEVYYGGDQNSLFVRVDFAETAATLDGLEIQVRNQPHTETLIGIENGRAVVRRGTACAAFRSVLEIAVPRAGGEDTLSLSFWQDGLPVEAIPREGTLRVSEAPAWNV
jgi:hypothetical protein